MREKTCSRCASIKPETEYHFTTGRLRRCTWCKACESQRKREYYANPANKQRHRERQKKWTDSNLALRRRYNADRKDAIDEIKSVPCKDCGNRYPPYVMDFDHRNPDDKLFNISTGKAKRWEVVLAEIAKCDVVCSNCHRIRSHVRLQERLLSKGVRSGIAGNVGERSGAAKLTNDTVAAIRIEAAAGVSRRDLAVKYGISPRNISAVVSRNTWKHVR